MLSDAAIERYSRQILLPEVGGRGQERLCGTTATVRGSDDAATFAAMLLAAAGMHVVCEDGPSGRVTITLDARTAVMARVDGTSAVVTTLVGRPCAQCVTEAHPPSSADRPHEAHAEAQAIGALAAGEALRVALGLAAAGRMQAFDLGRGTFEARTVRATDGCVACSGTSA